jgi:hypothetical protein
MPPSTALSEAKITVSVRLLPSQAAWLDEWADEVGGRSAALRLLLRNAMERNVRARLTADGADG